MAKSFLFKRTWLPLVAAMGFTLYSCTEDVYVPGKKRDIAPAENPFGEDFKAPSGFDWSMLQSVSLDVSVRDEYSGQYEYLIEVFTSSPLSSETSTPLAAGYANTQHHYTTTLSLPAGLERLYIRKTSPTQTQEVYEFAVTPQMVCKLYWEAVTSRAVFPPEGKTTATRSMTEGVTDASYGQADIPADAVVWELRNEWESQWTPGNYILRTANEHIRSNVTIGKGVHLFIDSPITLQKLEMYGGASVTIMPGKSLASTYLNLSGGEEDCADCYNYGTVTVDQINTNNNIKSVITNFSGAIIRTTSLSGGCTIINEGTITADVIDMQNSKGNITNGCAMIINRKFAPAGNITLDNGSITGSQRNGEWQPIEEFTLYNDAGITLANGSFIKASRFLCGYNATIQATGGKASLLQVNEITYQWTTRLSGPLYLDCGREINAGENHSQPQCQKEDVVTTSLGNAICTIETCSGIMYDKKKEDGPSDPDNPYEKPDTPVAPSTPSAPAETTPFSQCTYAFEDQWPIYGDYDLNDLVITIDEVKLYNDNKGELKEVKLSGDLKAVGATYILGIGIRFMGLSKDLNNAEFKLNWKKGSAKWEEDNDHPTLIMTEDAHYTLSGSNEREFINTDPEGRRKEYKGYDISIMVPNRGIRPEAFDIRNIDMFIFIRKNAYAPYRREIHVAGFKPTNWADQSYSGTGNDNGQDNYTSNESLSWGICVPTNQWRWPQEYLNIINESVYPEFEDWVRSGSSMNSTWYYNYDSNKVY